MAEKFFGLERFREIASRKINDGFFDRSRPVIVTRAPGRLDLMGGIADYSGSLVLQYPIREATFAAAQLSNDRTIRIESVADAESLRTFAFEVGLDELLPGGKLGGIAEARQYFAGDADGRWAAYAVGAFVILAEALHTRFDSGVRVLIHSDVPLGKGVSSSAALEVSVMKAVVELNGIGGLSDRIAESAGKRPVATAPGSDMSCRDLALLCQRVENEIVGAPCGVMDQMVSACGSENELVEILCQPAELLGTLALPEEVEIWGIDSGIRHSVTGADYGTVRTAASMGYRIIAEIAGFSVQNAGPGHVTISDAKWNGYLANIDPEMFRDTFAAELPESVSGREFIAAFYGVSDPFASIDPESIYPVRAATAHPVFENARVRRFAQLLRGSSPDLAALGSLMYGSHESYSACGLGSDGTDLLVDLVKIAGPPSRLFGAKITGGGSGGTVAVLGLRGGGDAIDAIAKTYGELTGRRTQIFSGSSPGAYRFGREILNP
jgi:galactokinase